MILDPLFFAGGVLTILSPCILPSFPLSFLAPTSFRRSGLPLLAGIAATFSLVAAVATLAGGWIIRANQIGRGAAILVFLLLGLTLLFPRLAEYTSRPFVRLGGKVQVQETSTPSAGRSFLLGISTGYSGHPALVQFWD